VYKAKLVFKDKLVTKVQLVYKAPQVSVLQGSKDEPAPKETPACVDRQVGKGTLVSRERLAQKDQPG